MKKLITLCLIILLLIPLAGCNNNEDYTKQTITSDAIITEYYTSGGALYQVIHYNRQTDVSIITTYYWKTSDRSVSELDRIEVITIGPDGELITEQ